MSCIKCGKCCIMPDDNPCPNLLETKLCSRYYSRYGRLIFIYHKIVGRCTIKGEFFFCYHQGKYLICK